MEQVPERTPLVTKALALDLLAKARRRIGEESREDTLARLYRALEASASWRPAGQGVGSTGRIPPAPTVPP